MRDRAGKRKMGKSPFHHSLFIYYASFFDASGTIKQIKAISF